MEWDGDTGYEVTSVYDKEDKHTVDINKRSCSCREWDLTSIPCQHACCAIYHKDDEPEKFMSDFYHKINYLNTYRHNMKCIAGKKL